MLCDLVFGIQYLYKFFKNDNKIINSQVFKLTSKKIIKN